MSYERIIWDKLTAYGLTPAGAAGLMGNLYAESGLNPKNLQNSCETKLGFDYTAVVDCGAYDGFVSDCAGYNGRKNGYDWCDVFVDWCFVTTFGRELAQKLLCQPIRSLGAGTKYSMDYYKKKGQFFQMPNPGDQIFFGTATVTSHTGLVVAVADGYVHTIEGNAGNPSAVRACKYSLRYAKIKGYGRPDWSLVPDEKEDDDMKYYEKLADVPAWYRPTVEKLVKKGVLNGTGGGVLNVSEDFCRTMTVLDRLGKLD